MSYSDFEVEVLQVFWKLGNLTAPEVHEHIQAKRQVAYNTVKTIVDRLEKKGALKRVRKYGRTILFEAVVEQDEVTKPMLQGFLDRLFQGDRRALLSHLLKEEELSREDVAYLESLVREVKGEDNG